MEFSKPLLVSLVILAFSSGASTVVLIMSIAGANTSIPVLLEIIAVLGSFSLTTLNYKIMSAWGDRFNTMEREPSYPSDC